MKSVLHELRYHTPLEYNKHGLIAVTLFADMLQIFSSTLLNHVIPVPIGEINLQYCANVDIFL